jgi:hypothetical protein
MTTFEERAKQLNKELQTKKLKEEWVIVEYQGYSNRKIKEFVFITFDDALRGLNKLRSWNKVAGVGGRWRHYFSFPAKREVK